MMGQFHFIMGQFHIHGSERRPVKWKHLRGSTNEKIFFSCSSPYELSFWRDVEVVSTMSKHVFVS